MIYFDIASARPTSLTEPVLKQLGQFLARVLRQRRKREVGVKFVSPKEIHRLNLSYRHVDRPTDVLSFSSLDANAALPNPFRSSDYLGDLVICPSYARTEAKRRGISLHEELLRLLAHGTLHLAGYDHAKKKDELEMFSLQERVVDAMSQSRV